MQPTDNIVSVSRRIGAPAATIFAILADPRNHPLVDGSGMLRGCPGAPGGAGGPISGAGDVFDMLMHHDEMGDYEMSNHVIEYEAGRRIGWEPVMKVAGRAEDQPGVGRRAQHRWTYELTPLDATSTLVTETFDCSRAPEWLRTAVKGGTVWIRGMTVSLEKLDELSRRP